MNRYSGRHTLFHIGLFLAPLIPLALLSGLYPYPRYVITAPDFVILWGAGLAISYTLVAVHELGHVIGGWLVGIHVSTIAIGSWKKWASFRIGRVNVVLRAGSGFGFVRPKHTIHNLPLWKIAIFLFAGLTAEVVFLLATLRLHAPADLLSFSDVFIEYFRLCVIWAVAIHLLHNLPPSHGTPNPEFATDGTQFFWYCRAKTGRRDDSYLFGQKQELCSLWSSGEKERALELAQDLLKIHPADHELRRLLGTFHAELGRTQEAERIWREMITERIGPLKLAEILDCLCCLALFHGRSDLLKESDAWSAEALRYAPNAITLKGTRGSLLVEFGRTDEGISMLQDVLKETDCPLDHVISSAFLAKAFWITADFPRAEHYLEKAERLDPGHCAVRRIKAELRSPRSAASMPAV